MTRALPVEDVSDAAIIEQSRRDPERFAAVFDRYYFQIHGFAAQRLGPSLADDVAAETFLVAFDRRDRYDVSREDARPWLYGIVANLIARHHRAEARWYRALSRTPLAQADDGHADQVAGRVDAQAHRAPLMAALTKIPSSYREVLLLVAWGGLNSEEAAEALGITGAAVRARGRLARWALIPAVAAAVAAALVIVPGRFGDPRPPITSSRDVLLVAADTAERTPEGTGTYWHITITKKGSPTQEYWYRRDGHFWIKGKGMKGEGKLLEWPSEPQPFAVGPLRMSFEELRSLPADEDALYTRLRADVPESGVRINAGQPMTAAEQDSLATMALLSLIGEAPVSPEVRAAAYRALASRPGVVDLGETDGGRRLQIPVAVGNGTMVVDQDTGRIRETSVWAPLTGGLAHTQDGGMVTIDARWTDRLPPG
ncbi:sigma-70 family RNA polymerase sigma factor [Nonomuraea antimicrobica]